MTNNICTCEFTEKGVLKKACTYHLERDLIIRKRTAIFLKVKIGVLFRGTHLIEMRDKVFEEIEKIS